MKRVVFITGASRGIGLATAKKFAAEGFDVAGFYKNNPGPEVPGVTYFQVDIANPSSIEGSFTKAFETFGRIDVLVNCAGIYGYKKLQEYPLELMDSVINTNERGTYLFTKVALTRFTEGAIVNVASIAGQIGSVDPVYAGTKGAILAFTKSMARALAPKIRVNCVAPGITESDMARGMDEEALRQRIEATLLKKIATPEDIASGIYFLASESAGHITGACLDVSGGAVLR